MKRKIGRLCMMLGAVLILCAAGLLGYNRWDAARAEKASQEVLGELEQTMQKTITEHRQENETPQPVLDPAQEMTTVEVEGQDYIGVLSIPAAGLELPVMAQWSYAGLKVAPGGGTAAPPMPMILYSAATTTQSISAPSSGWLSAARCTLRMRTVCAGATRWRAWRLCIPPRSRR